MDTFYFSIKIVSNYKIICSLFFYNKKYHFNNYPICFTAKNDSIMYILMAQHDLIKLLSLNHIFYISKEIYKAHLCLSLNQFYIQS
uniref:DUF4346 domain-containing protein n=2 Tax=Gracilariopsis TaxID=2781 RepID=A0A1C9CEV5_9FLOR|nr:hypothetical protein [Gracilariopsis lemaneiformis]YP_009294670.1 hypothetical protein Gch_071 [Gracilariopsis chorda]AJO68552.1 hypothetical protein [Gracilariopsis lemaneiformis]AML79823.1 hypothetical protein [Gracilariopsis lemaneiformis]AOM66930.1 hypothetical protein Gch_071 [Gracilariopsis chorda]